MATEALEQAIATTRGVLVNVSKEQLGDDTPCAAWKVSDLINHIVGGQYFFEASVNGEAPTNGTDFSATDFVAAFDEGAQRCVVAFNADGALAKTLTLPWGQMPARGFLGIAATDTFTHGWDLAKATGQDASLNEELAGQLLAGAKQFISPAFRSPEGNPFGLEREAPAGASNADQLAAFLGRQV